ncbi:radical SAM family heme chaperone HemW [Thermodesulfobacteriota bacterium]
MLNAGLYIHIPFCKTKCPYCGFYSIADPSLISRWLKALKKEVLHYRDRFDVFNSLYLGGGTPTLLRLSDLETLLDCLHSHFNFTKDTEITIEANPGDMTGEMINGLKSLGFNRINLGVQSFDNRQLMFLGRRHTADEAEQALTLLRSSGFDNIGMDLIYGLKDQPLKEWMQTLKKAILFKPEHLSCYQLSIEKKTPFWKMREKGIIKHLSEEKERDLFLATSGFLENNGYLHYEISNFARGKEFCSRHNRKYWGHVPYLGLGPSAHSFRNSSRWWNYSSVRRYCEVLERGNAPVEGFEDLTGEQKRLECVSLGLRTSQGFNLNEVPAHNGLDRVISLLKDSGHLQVVNGRVTPTKKGFLVADRLPLCFFP